MCKKIYRKYKNTVENNKMFRETTEKLSKQKKYTIFMDWKNQT